MGWNIQSVERIKWLTPNSISSKTILQKNQREIPRFREQNWKDSSLVQNILKGSPSGWNERTPDHNSNPHEETKYTGEGNYIDKYRSQY